jgi:DNA-binding beta-propeller fold protein YncE
MLAASSVLAQEPAIETTSDRVGRWRDDVIVTPVNQILTPYGRQIELPGLRPQALALSPNGKLLVVSGKTSELLVIDVDQAKIADHVGLPGEEQEKSAKPVSPNVLKPDRKGQVSFTGLTFSHDGKHIYLSNVNGSIKVFTVKKDGTVQPSRVFSLPAAMAPQRGPEIPSGLALSDDDSRLYVCGNLSNKLLELNTADGMAARSWDVGVAPYDVVLVDGKAFVSNWGGRRPKPGDLTGPAGQGTEVRVDPVRHIASEGSVSIIDLIGKRPAKEVLTGLHASALAVSPDRRFVVCANAGSDQLSLIDVARETVVETVWAKHRPSDLFGASPNALAFDETGKRLFVANGTQNAVAVFDFDPDDKGETKLEGLIPAGWFPGAIAFDARRKSLYVANIKGLPTLPKTRDDGVKGFNSHQYQGSMSLMPLPSANELPKLSERVARNFRRASIDQAALPARKNQPPRAVPERIGEPSLIEHVVYVIKENRTYDQVLGEHKRGRGQADLCAFGRDVAPNQYKLVDEFVLLDNTYCSGLLSADGHQWSTTAFATDYMEKSFADFPRSYPDGMGEGDKDALAYSPAGFLWDNVVAHRKTIRNYGEFMGPKVRWRDKTKKGSPDFSACYRTWKGESEEVVFESEPSVESIRPYSPTAYVGWEMTVPDQYRADFIIRELKEFEKKGTYPNLVIICLPNDHTSGTRAGSPTPAACVADNDLAFGRIVEALSHSRFWNKMAVFGIEDDPQAGWDHVSGYRTTAYLASPYAKREAVISTQYNTTSLIRTIEQILGLPPMNQFDAGATPMYDCFTDKPNFTPFVSVANLVPLDQMNPEPKAIRDPILRQDALVSARINFREVDKAPEDVLNRILWRAQKGTAIPYPEWAVSFADDDDD